MCAQKCRKVRQLMRKLRLKYKAEVQSTIATEVAKKVAKWFCYLQCYRDWPKYSELLKNACLRFLRATADHPLPTRAGGQQSEELYSRLNFLIKYLGQSLRECWFFIKGNNSSPTPSLQLKEGVSIPFHLPLFQKGMSLFILTMESLANEPREN